MIVIKNIAILIIAGLFVILSPYICLSQQTSTLKLKFSLSDSGGDIIKSNDSNYTYVDYGNGDEMSLDANNDQIRYDTVSRMFIVTITVPRYNEYSFILKNTYSKESMVFRISMDGNLSEQLTIDEIRFTPGTYVFNLKTSLNYYNRSNLNINKSTKHEENGPCTEIKEVDWDAPHINTEVYIDSSDIANVKSLKSEDVGIEQISTPINSDLLEADYYFVGGVRVPYFKDLNRIGIAFQSNSNDFSKFLNKYDLEFDRRFNYRSFNVFRFTEDISIEERRKIIESINREENLKIAGDLLFHNQSSASIITNQIIIHWKELDLEKRKEFLIQEGLEEINKENEKKGRFAIFELQNAYNYRVIEVCKKLVNSGLAHIAEPNLFSNVELD
jgi:hypothetical protein